MNKYAYIFYSWDACSCGYYANFGYYDPYLRASYGLNDTSSIYANVFLGLKGIKVLGINIGDIGKKWEWQLLNYDKTIIPETALFEYKIK